MVFVVRLSYCHTFYLSVYNTIYISFYSMQKLHILYEYSMQCVINCNNVYVWVLAVRQFTASLMYLAEKSFLTSASAPVWMLMKVPGTWWNRMEPDGTRWNLDIWISPDL